MDPPFQIIQGNDLDLREAPAVDLFQSTFSPNPGGEQQYRGREHDAQPNPINRHPPLCQKLN